MPNGPRFLLLGPLTIEFADGTVRAWRRAAERQAFLALLLEKPGKEVLSSDILARVWGDNDRVLDRRSPLSSLARELRRDLRDPEGLHNNGKRWVLPGGRGRRDVDECDTLLALAHQALRDRRHAEAAQHAETALDLFRGRPLAGLENFDGLRDVIEQLECRWDRVAAVLIVARREVGAAGTGPDLRHDAAARGRAEQLDRAVAEAGELVGRTVTVPGHAGGRPPLAGRDELVSLIRDAILDADRRGVNRIIVRLSGRAGIGKTALAQHLAVALQPLTPAGKLVLDLRGTRHRPRHPAQAQAEALRTLGAGPPQRDQVRDAYQQAFRRKAATQRMLLLLDHADSVEQVRELLPPPEAQTVVMVASQRVLDGLENERECAFAGDVPALDDGSALRLLDDLVGEQVARDSRPAATRLVELCAGVPAFLGIAGSKVALGEASFAECVRAIEEEDIDYFDDSERDVRSFIAFGLREASRSIQQALAVVTRLDCPVVDAELLGAALDLASETAEPALTELDARRLLDPYSSDARGQPRWTVHSLVRSFGRELPPDVDWAASLARVVDSAAATTAQIVETVEPERIGPNPDAEVRPRADVAGDVPAALAWFDERREGLVALVGQAHREAEWEQCWRLAAAVVPLLELRIAGPDWEHVLSCASDAAGHLSQPQWRSAWVLLWRAAMLRYGGQFARAFTAAAEAKQIFASCHDALGAAAATAWMGDIRTGEQRPGEEQAARLAAAERLMRAALVAFELIGHRRGIASASEVLGEILVMRGASDEGERELERALAQYRALGDHRRQGTVLRLRGATHRREGRLDAALTDGEAAVRSARLGGDPAEAARAEVSLGLLQHQLGDSANARENLERAHDFFEGVYDQRWLAVACFHLAEVIASPPFADPHWRALAGRALAISIAVEDNHYEQLCRRLLENPHTS